MRLWIIKLCINNLIGTQMLLTCPTCNDLFILSSEQRRHLLSCYKQNTKGGNFEFYETEYGNSFARKKDVQAHKQIRTEKALVCTIDNMKFANKPALRTHICVFIQTKKQFQCTVCGNKYSHRST